MDNSGHEALAKKVFVGWCMVTGGEAGYLFQMTGRACCTEFLEALAGCWFNIGLTWPWGYVLHFG